MIVVQREPETAKIVVSEFPSWQGPPVAHLVGRSKTMFGKIACFPRILLSAHIGGRDA